MIWTTVMLFIILALIFFSSKAIGIFLLEKLKLEREESTGIGYLVNLALFFVIQLPTMMFKLSFKWLFVLGCLHLGLCLFAIIYSIKQKKLFKFSKKELLALGLATIMMILFALFIDFGYIETYDTYFYSILTNASKVDNKLSFYNTYTGLIGIQNFYKYMSYYYYASFFGILFKIKLPYLILVWCLSFMNYFFMFMASLTVVRITSNKHFNNILTIFVWTLYHSIFRAPLNAVHILTFIVPLYLWTYLWHYIENKDKSFWGLAFICVIASISLTSSALFCLLPALYCIFIVNAIKKVKSNKFIYLLILPLVFLFFLYLYESQKQNLFVFIPMLVLFISFWFLFYSKMFNSLVKFLAIFMLVFIPMLLCFAPNIINNWQMETGKNILQKNGEESPHDDKPLIENEKCLDDTSLQVKNGQELLNFDKKKHGTALYNDFQKITNSSDKESIVPKISSYLTVLVHSTLMYGGLLFLFIYGLFYLRKDFWYLVYFIYLVTFFNPLARESLNFLSQGLGERILLFFNTFFAILGLKYFNDWFSLITIKKRKEKLHNFFLKIINIVYLAFFVLSVSFYLASLKKPNYQKYNMLYKVPDKLLSVNWYFNDYIKNLKHKPVVFFTSSVFNISLVDDNPNNKIKVFFSSEEQYSFSHPNVIKEKNIINIYFESNLKTTFREIYAQKDDEKIVNIANCEINKLLKKYQINYVLTAYSKEKEEQYEVIYKTSDIIILKVGDFNE